MVLLHPCRWKFLQKETLQHSIELEFYSQKRQIRFWSHPLGGGRGKVLISSIARWKARGRLSICYNWTFFASSYGSDVISTYWSKSALFKEGWVSLSWNFRWKRTSPTNHYWCQKTRLIALLCGIKMSAVCCLFSSQSTRVTDGRTDRQNYDFQDRACIA